MLYEIMKRFLVKKNPRSLPTSHEFPAKYCTLQLSILENKRVLFLKKYEVYQISRIVLFEINRWPLDVLTFLSHGFGTNNTTVTITYAQFYFHFFSFSDPNCSNCHCGHICHTHFPLEPIAQWLDLCHSGRKLSFYCSTNGLSDRLNGFHL